MDTKKIKAAIEADMGEALPGIEQALNEAAAIASGNVAGARLTTLTHIAVFDTRKTLGLSQAKFAKLINTPVRTVQEWEQGRANPPGAALKLCELLVNNPALVA